MNHFMQAATPVAGSAECRAIAVIPARGGSKGLPRKNVKDLCGKPLIAYSIEAALEAELVDRVIVSTEDEEIATVAREFGAEVPFMRPQHMAGDHSPIMQAVQYTLERLADEEGGKIEAYAVLYPSHPFRPPGLVDTLLGKVLKQHTHAMCVRPLKSSPFAYITDDDQARYLMSSSAERTYRPYGLCECRSMIPRSINRYLHVVEGEVYFTDIDTPEDFVVAEKILQHGMYSEPYVVSNSSYSLSA